MMTVYTVKEVSVILKLGKNQTYALMNSKAFPSYKIGSKMFVTEDALNEWLSKITNQQILV